MRSIHICMTAISFTMGRPSCDRALRPMRGELLRIIAQWSHALWLFFPEPVKLTFTAWCTYFSTSLSANASSHESRSVRQYTRLVLLSPTSCAFGAVCFTTCMRQLHWKSGQCGSAPSDFSALRSDQSLQRGQMLGCISKLEAAMSISTVWHLP